MRNKATVSSLMSLIQHSAGLFSQCIKAIKEIKGMYSYIRIFLHADDIIIYIIIPRSLPKNVAQEIIVSSVWLQDAK